MRRVLFFIFPRWAFGSIHFALLKRLRAHGIHADILDWTTHYTRQEFEYFQQIYDVIVTTPESAHFLADTQQYNVLKHKIAVIGHSDREFVQAQTTVPASFYDDLAAFAVVTKDLVPFTASLGIRRVPNIVTIGVDTDFFTGPPATTLRSIEHVGPHEWLDPAGQDCKRAGLLDAVLEGLPFTKADVPKCHYLAMPARYWRSDALLSTSRYESCGLPPLEAAAAGRLVVGTPVGYFAEHHAGLGSLCRLEPTAFVQDARAALLYYRDSPLQYRQRCQEAQDYCRQHFDWDRTLPSWLEVLA